MDLFSTMSGVKRLLDLPMYKQKIDLESRSNLLNFNSISMKPYARGYALRDVIFKNGQTTVSLAYKKGRKEKKNSDTPYRVSGAIQDIGLKTRQPYPKH